MVHADVVVVPSWFDDEREPGEVLSNVLREAHGRGGATIVGLCLGAIPRCRRRSPERTICRDPLASL